MVMSPEAEWARLRRASGGGRALIGQACVDPVWRCPASVLEAMTNLPVSFGLRCLGFNSHEPIRSSSHWQIKSIKTREPLAGLKTKAGESFVAIGDQLSS
ncbi:hypothetical protein Nepgr_029553 [Nepenthes gracilis]|uniref:Uncharacterized protein n=1 Tax=Nepenthes gracilis TaxID=150966 RepID=A0AAD3TCP8_NEPGR|nr:hypothetical protein Nepgr_029553 [Nepenthes gracilis]